MWWVVALVVVSFVATMLLTPKPKFENARATSLDDLRYPTASQGSPVPLVFGRVLIKGPNTVWAGDFEAVPIKKKMQTGFLSSKKVVVGHTYYVGLQLVLCLGPATLHKIKSDKDILWTGTASLDGAAVNINLPNLYGGREKGGGFVANCVYYTGSMTQAINAYLESKIGVGDVPAYRGFSYIVFPHANIGESNQLRAMSFEVSRYSNGLGLTSGKHMIGDDCNPMEVLYQAFALEFGALGVPVDLLDLVAFKACAETLYNESNGMSLLISSPNSGKDVANEVLRQVDAILYQDPQTGKIIPRLIRNDYVLEDLPIFDESNIIAVRQFTSKMWEDTINQMRVTFTDRSENYTTNTAIDQDLANISAQERIRTATQSYPGVMVGSLALELATRDLSQASVPLMGANIEMNRQGASLRPGDVFIWSWNDFKLAQVVMRVKNFDLGALVDNRISVEVSQDEFAVGLTVFSAPDGAGSGAVSPDNPAIALTTRFVMEAPYMFGATSGTSLGASQGIIVVSAVPSTAAESLSVYYSTDTVVYAQAESDLVFNATGTLNAAIAATANTSTGIIPSIIVTTSYADEILPVTATDIAAGGGLFMVNGELFAHQGAVNNNDGTVTLSNVRRGLLDTATQAHASGDRVWFISGDNLVDDPVANDGTIRVKLIPNTYSDSLAVSSAPYDAITLTRRALRPLHPGYVQFDGATPFTAPPVANGSKTVTWANRSRVEAVIRSIADTNNANEITQETIFRYRVNAGAWVEAVIAAGTTTYTFDAGALVTDVVTYEIYSRRDGLLSRAKWVGTSAGGVMVGALV